MTTIVVPLLEKFQHYANDGRSIMATTLAKVQEATNKRHMARPPEKLTRKQLELIRQQVPPIPLWHRFRTAQNRSVLVRNSDGEKQLAARSYHGSVHVGRPGETCTSYKAYHFNTSYQTLERTEFYQTWLEKDGKIQINVGETTTPSIRRSALSRINIHGTLLVWDITWASRKFIADKPCIIAPYMAVNAGSWPFT